jgi:transcriptional regulatory protein LevR
MPRVTQVDVNAIAEFAAERREEQLRIRREREYELKLLERIAIAVERLVTQRTSKETADGR